MNLTDLATLALLGTERQELPRGAAGTPADDLQAQLNLENRESALLSAAAITGAHERAGRLPVQDLSPVPGVSARETLAYASVRSSALLGRMLSGEFPILLPEWLTRAGQLQQVAPPEYLPALLALGQETPPLRAALAAVIGARGRWLASQNPEWSWVAGDEGGEDIWHTGDTRARALFLERLRREDPGHARDLLQASWKDEEPDDRATFLNTFHIRLSPDDEPFLEGALDDKRKEVRRAAAALLGRVPSSALASRMLERARSLVRFIPGERGSVLRLKMGRAATIEVTLPQTCDKAMQRDGIDLKPPRGMGEKASWLSQILEAVSLDLWLTEFNASADQIIAASLASEWKAELLETWSRAAIQQSNAGWTEAVLDVVADQQQFARIHALLETLPSPRREARVIQWLADGQRAELHGALIVQSTHNWSLEFSEAVLKWLRAVTAQPSVDWQRRTIFKDLAARFHPDILPMVAQHWPEDSAEWAFWSKGVEELLSVAQFRHDLLTA